VTVAADIAPNQTVRISNARWTLKDVAKLIFALIASQAIFWAIVLGLVYGSPLNLDNLDQYRVQSLQVAPALSSDNPSPAGPYKAAAIRQISLPNPGLLRFSVNVKDPNQGIGIFIPRLADNAVLLVNGKRLAPPVGEWAPKSNRTGVVGMSFAVPEANLVAGPNQFELFAVRSCCEVFVNSVFAGPLPQMQAISTSARFYRIELTWIIIATSLLIGLVAASLLPLKRGQAFLWAVIGCSLTVSIGSYFYVDTGRMITPAWRAWYGHIIGALVGYLAFLSLVNAWTNGPLWLYRAAIAIGSICVLISGALVPFQTHGQVLIVARIMLAFVMVLAIIGVYALLWRYVQTKQIGRYWQAGLLIISSGAAVVDYLFGLEARIQPIYFVPFSNLTLMTALGIALAQRGAQMYLEAEAANLTLAARIDAKEQELAQSAAALRAQEAETAIQTERARIMRDMHDGMGGQLLTLLMQARDPDAKREEMEETVEIAIADLRLLIDSLDSVGDSLDIALAMFRERLAPRLEAAKVQLNWPNSTVTIEREFTPGQILSIYRILQEAISNALRHGKPTQIFVTQTIDADTITLALCDNGSGMVDNVRAGRGLTNMRRRASEMNGSLTVEAGAIAGVCVVLKIPASLHIQP
jgi:signal transduction histidine kinase